MLNKGKYLIYRERHASWIICIMYVRATPKHNLIVSVFQQSTTYHGFDPWSGHAKIKKKCDCFSVNHTPLRIKCNYWFAQTHHNVYLNGVTYLVVNYLSDTNYITKHLSILFLTNKQITYSFIPVVRWFYPRRPQNKDLKTGMCCFTELMSKNKYNVLHWT